MTMPRQPARAAPDVAARVSNGFAGLLFFQCDGDICIGGEPHLLPFDIRDQAAQEFSQTLAALFPGQSPTSSGYEAWRTARPAPP